MEPQKIQDTFFSQRRLQREFLLDDGVWDRHLVLVQEIRERAVSFRRVTDDRGRLAVARPVAEFLERGVQAVILSRIDAMDAPIERFKHALELGHRKDHPVREIELPVVAIDHHAQVVEMLLAGVHHGFPDRTLLQFAIACQAVDVKARCGAPRNRQALRDAEPLPHRTGGHVDARQQRTRVAVQDAAVRPRVAQHGGVEVAQLGIDGRKRRHRVPLAEHEQVLTPAGRIDDVDVDESAVVQRDQGDRR